MNNRRHCKVEIQMIVAPALDYDEPITNESIENIFRTGIRFSEDIEMILDIGELHIKAELGENVHG